MKRHKKLIAYMLALTLFTAYVIMDTFVITRVYSIADSSDTAAIDDNDSGADIQLPDDQSGAVTDGNENSAHKHGPDGAPGSGSRGPGNGGHGKHSKSSSGTSGAHSSGSAGSGSTESSSGTGISDNSGPFADESASISAKNTGDSYSDGRIEINMSEYTVSGTAVHVAEVNADPAAYLKTAFAQGAYGRNVTQTTSDIADSVNAILAINGDYYGAQEKGYVIRNGVIYRSTARSGQEDLVIYKDGSFGIINESEVTAEQLLKEGAVQVLSFGPALVENGKVSVSAGEEVGRAMASNPRTAIGIKEDGTYLFVVSDGRTDESEGLSLLQLAEFMQSQGAVTAYNLDGGGSSTMVFNGSVVNTPTGGGIGNGSGSERKVSDIVYIGY